jgi:alcohol dehydrogenase class IV
MQDSLAKQLTLLQPKTLVVGNGCARQCVEDLHKLGCKHIFLVCAKPVREQATPLVNEMQTRGISVTIDDSVNGEPDIALFTGIVEEARNHTVDAVVGFGGGSVLDVAKLVAALIDNNQPIQELFGIGKLTSRNTHLVCLPTTAGTGSEVSPNAILLDESENLKKGVVSPWLTPDAAYVDPALTLSVPPDVTAATGLDALTHCIEAYANRFAHPMVDLYALKGIELIGAHLETAYRDGSNVTARGQVALGSLYGGLCLGPVNTAAVHALAYPLGGEFHIPHGVSNALLLAAVLEFNLPAAPERYARIAEALGCPPATSSLETARLGLEKIRELSQSCGIPTSLSQLGIPEKAIKKMAESALTVTRLLKNNPRELNLNDAEAIYRSVF